MLKAVSIFLLIGVVATDSSLSSVLSRLLSEARSSKDQPPVILLISNKALQASNAQSSSSSELVDSSETVPLWKIFGQKSDLQSPNRYRARPPRNQAVFIQKPLNKPNRNKLPFRLDQNLRSGVYQSLLSLRNSLRCGAQDECKDDCGENLNGKKKKKCEMTCEIKFECEFNEEEKEEENDDDDVSTKGPPASEESVEKCRRC